MAQAPGCSGLLRHPGRMTRSEVRSAGEHPRATVARELYEEPGLDLLDPPGPPLMPTCSETARCPRSKSAPMVEVHEGRFPRREDARMTRRC
jgi:hypothetical protein